MVDPALHDLSETLLIDKMLLASARTAPVLAKMPGVPEPPSLAYIRCDAVALFEL